MSSISKAESILEKAFRNGRLHHAILLYGNSATALEDVAKCVRHDARTFVLHDEAG